MDDKDNSDYGKSIDLDDTDGKDDNSNNNEDSNDFYNKYHDGNGLDLNNAIVNKGVGGSENNRGYQI